MGCDHIWLTGAVNRRWERSRSSGCAPERKHPFAAQRIGDPRCVAILWLRTRVEQASPMFARASRFVQTLMSAPRTASPWSTLRVAWSLTFPGALAESLPEPAASPRGTPELFCGKSQCRGRRSEYRGWDTPMRQGAPSAPPLCALAWNSWSSCLSTHWEPGSLSSTNGGLELMSCVKNT